MGGALRFCTCKLLRSKTMKTQTGLPLPWRSPIGKALLQADIPSMEGVSVLDDRTTWVVARRDGRTIMFAASTTSGLWTLTVFDANDDLDSSREYGDLALLARWVALWMTQAVEVP